MCSGWAASPGQEQDLSVKLQLLLSCPLIPKARSAAVSFYSIFLSFSKVLFPYKILLLFYYFADIRIPLIQTESLGSIVPESEHQSANRNYSFLSEINR